MAEIPNLLDMFQNNRKEIRTASKPTLDAKAQAAAHLLPIDSTAVRNQGTKPGKSTPFHAKVEKSKAKLAAKGHKFFPQNKAAARPEAPAAKETAAPIADRPEAAQTPDSRKRQAAVSEPASRPESAKSAQPAQKHTAPAKGMDAESIDAIQEGLAELGIDATEAQLNDPAFLLDMLHLLQTLPSMAALAGEAEGAVPVAAAGPEAKQLVLPLSHEDEIVSTEDDEAEAPLDATVLPSNGNKLSRGELAELLAGRATGLAQAATTEQAQVQVSAQAPTTTPKEWQGIQVRPQAEGPGTEPLPMADLDRLRVMQSAAMQAGGKSEITDVDLSLESDSQEPLAIDEAAAISGEAGADGEPNAQEDLSGRNGDRTGAADLSVRKDGPLVARDGANGPQFMQSLDQARSVDHRAGIKRGMEPRAAGPEAGVLEQIARKMAAGAHKHGDEISIQLSPEHLGKVRVSLEMKDGVMAARIAVESDAVKKQVEAGLSTLKEALQNQGIQLQGMEVSVDQRHANLFNPDGSNAESFFHRNGRSGAHGEGRPAEAAPFEAAPEADTGRRWGYNTMEYIG